VAVVALNLGTYAFQLIAAQLLGPGGFGELAALLALVNLIGLPLGAVQIAVARQVAELRAAGQHHEVATFGRSFIMGALIGSVGLLVVYGLLLVPLQHLLGLSSMNGLLLLGLAIPASVFLPVVLGVLQGEQRFNEYSVALAATGVLRPAFFLALYFYGLRLAGAVVAMALAVIAGAGLALRSCAGSLRGGRSDLAVLWGPLRVLTPTVVGLLAITALTNVDLLFAKGGLSDHEAGVFSADAFAGRVILYLPVAMFAVMLPRVAARRVAGRDPIDILGRTIAVFLPAAVVAVAVLYLIPDFLLRVAFGAEYLDGAPDLWLFGLAASLFSLLNLYLNYDLARGEYRLSYELAVLAGLQVLLLIFIHDSSRSIILVDLALGVVALVYYEIRHRGAVAAIRAALAHWQRPTGAGEAQRPLMRVAAQAATGAVSGMSGRARGLWARMRFPLGITAVYSAITVAVTWPVAAGMSHSFFGFGNDNLGGIWNFWWWAHARSEGLDPNHSPLLGAPYGFDLGALPVQPFERWAGEFLTLAFGPVAAYNIIIMASFPLAGLTMYLLANYLLRNRWAAAFAGLIFAFSPFHFGMAMNYPALGSVQFVPLYFLFLVRAVFERRPRDLVGAVLTFGLLAAGSYYYAYYALWITLAVAAVYGIRKRAAIGQALGSFRAQVNTARGVATVAAVGLATTAVVAFLAWKPLQMFLDNRDSLSRPLSEAVRYSTRLYLWFVPGLDHPLWGDSLKSFYDGHLYDAPFNEQSMYLGYVPLALAILALVVVLRARRSAVGPMAHLRRALGFALVVGGAGAIIAVGPFLPLSPDYYSKWAEDGGAAKIPMVGWLMFELAPSFRFFSRAQVFVVMALALAAAGGAMWLFARIRRRHVAVLLAVVMVGAVGFEYANRPPARVVDMGGTPSVYNWLAKRPGDVLVAEYPMSGPAEPRSFYYQYWQPSHGKRLINVPGSPESVAFLAGVADIADPAVTRRLAEVGVDYVVVHTDLPPATYPPYQPVLPDDSLPEGMLDGYPQLELVATFPDAEVYRVLPKARTTDRIAGAVSFGAGFYPPERSAVGEFRWMDTRGEMSATALGDPGTPAQLDAVLESFAEPRDVRVAINGRVAATVRVSQQRTDVMVPFRLVEGTQRIVFTASPAAASPEDVTGAPDPRPLSVNAHSVDILPRP